jgi:hypothetical protein
MELVSGLSEDTGKFTRKAMEPGSAAGAEGHGRSAAEPGDLKKAGGRRGGAGGLVQYLSANVRASVAVKRGEYDARRLRSQRDVIRDVMLSAADCGTWLTLGELRALTRFGEASISAQLRHLRKMENGGYDVAKRLREDRAPAHASADGRGEWLWEYRVEQRIDRGPGLASGAGREALASLEI